MADDRETAFDLRETYVCLEGGTAGAHAIDVDASFWKTIHQRADLASGHLVAMIRYERDWSHWEMHPAGDEVVCLLSGAIDLIFEVSCDGRSEERRVPLRDRETLIVPRGVWHRAVVRTPGEGLHITLGAGTEHRSLT